MPYHRYRFHPCKGGSTSTIILGQCWPLQLPPTAKAVLISLADQANDSGVCWPSVGTIAKRTCLSERACQKAMVYLETAGFIRKDERPGRSTVFHISTGGERGAPLGVNVGRGRGERGAPGGERGSPRTVTEPSKEPRAARGTRLPPDWKPTQDLQGWAEKKRPDLNLGEVLERFRDYWAAQPGQKGVKLDWPATYRNWVRGEKRINGAHIGPTARPTIKCRGCGQMTEIWTSGRCDPCWRKEQGMQ